MEYVAKFGWLVVIVFFLSGEWKFVQDRLSPRVGKIYRTAGWIALIATCFFLNQKPDTHWVREDVTGPIVVTIRPSSELPVVKHVSLNGVATEDAIVEGLAPGSVAVT